MKMSHLWQNCLEDLSASRSFWKEFSLKKSSLRRRNISFTPLKAWSEVEHTCGLNWCSVFLLSLLSYPCTSSCWYIICHMVQIGLIRSELYSKVWLTVLAKVYFIISMHGRSSFYNRLVWQCWMQQVWMSSLHFNTNLIFKNNSSIGITSGLYSAS